MVGVKSSVSLLEDGQRQIADKFTYESTKPKQDTSQVSQMIDEENMELADITARELPELLNAMPTAYPLKKRFENLQLVSDSVSVLEQSLRQPDVDMPENEQEDVQPEILAKIMHTEETGLDLTAQPTTMYKRLFPEEGQEEQQKVDVSVAASQMQDVVVPTSTPSELHVNAVNPEIAQAVVATGAGTNPLPDNIYAEMVMKKEGPKVSNVAKGIKVPKKGKALEKEEPPWGQQDAAVAEVVGADYSNFLSVSVPDDEAAAAADTSQRIEYLLTMDAPKYASSFRLRGTQNPPWFPGYLSAFPNTPEIIRREASPNDVLHKAYLMVQPNIFSEESFVA